ncbi:hypothetical protein TNCV_3311291 [Trichonephila clavipes]|nr:hypothetical protein TNCV_3311291 [Trichonephila clavipes]
MGKECGRICNELTTKAKFCHSFQSDRQNVESRNMTGSILPNSSTTDIITVLIVEMIQNVRRVTLHELSSKLGLSYGSVQHIVSVMLRYSKIVL